MKHADELFGAGEQGGIVRREVVTVRREVDAVRGQAARRVLGANWVRTRFR
jgi:hypothetical protein